MTVEELKKTACDAIDAHREDIIALGERIAAEPELGFKEVRTAAKIQAVLDSLNLPHEDQVAITGIVAPLKGRRSKLNVAILGELDAVVVPGHPKADPVTGAAHCCGHHAQSAAVAGVAYALATTDLMRHLDGDITLMFVPAEEGVELEYRRGLIDAGKLSMLGGKPEFMHRGYFDGDAYFGITAAQSTIMNCGNYCVRTDADIARNAYNGSDPDITSQMGDQHDKFIVNGDMHCYRQGTEAETNGDMVFAIGNKAPGQFSDSVKVYGDLYIDGDIIFLGTGAAPTGAQPVVNVSGTIHMDGARKIIWKDISTGTEYELPHANGAGLVKAGNGWDTVIPNADGRHHMPEQGYLPLTGYVTDNDTHAYLARSYEGASSNDIFTASCSDCDASIMGNYASYLASNDPNALTASKAIGHKFADAMCTPLSTGSYVDPSDGVTKRACQDYFDLDNNTTVKQINCSVKLTPQEASYWINNNPNVYIVNLTHEDIVIALPLDVGGSNVGKLGASFKILNKARDYGEHHYVYFMWYDQNDESNCLYLNNSSIDASYGTVHRLPAGGTSMDIAGTQPGKTYHATFSPMSPGGFTTDSNGNLIELAQPGTRRGITIEFGDNAQNQNRYLVSDYLLTLPNGAELSDADLTNEDRIKESLKASINYRDVDVPGTGNVPARVVGNPPAPNSNIDNVIMYLVPDYVAVKCDGTTGYQQKVQGVLYAWNSQFAISYSTGSVWYGQLKCDRILYDQDATDFQWLRDIPMGEQSLMSYAGRNGGGGTSSNGYEIRYYNY